LSLDDIDDSCGSEGDRLRKGRFTKRLRSPDRSVWDISSYLPGGDRKNEIEKMFERFKIKMAADDGDDVNQDDHSKMDVRSVVTAGVSDSDISPAHNEHSKLIGRINKGYSTSVVNDVERTVASTDTKEGGEKGEKKKHKHKKDKHDKEKKSRHSKSKHKHASEPDSAVIIPTGAHSTVPSSDEVFPTESLQNSSADVHRLFSHSVTSRIAESAELGLPSHQISCDVDDVFSETPGESNVDDIGSADFYPLDFSTSELLPEVRCLVRF